MGARSLNYQHAYHAGNFADVFKHAILTLLLQSLLQKDKPFCYFETHAGMGLYDLQQTTAQKTQEYVNGILPLLQITNPPDFIQPYLQIVKDYNKTAESLQYYPGSPLIARAFLRAEDRMILNELHPEIAQQLKLIFKQDKQVAIHHQNGYQALKALLPPLIKRGLVLIDPPYEEPHELQNLVAAMSIALQRWPMGIYALWYPLKNKLAIQTFLQQLKKKTQKELLIAEINLGEEEVKSALKSCGMVIINPPWQFELLLKNVTAWLWQTLSTNKQGNFQISTMH
jgi:23S rRNA (adenine2030-N6)-methyltransferase